VNDSKHASVKRILAKVFLLLLSSTIALSISTVNGNLFTISLAKVLLSPSKVTRTIGEVLGGDKPEPKSDYSLLLRPLILSP